MDNKRSVRKKIKKIAKCNMKKHYWIFVMLCLAMVIMSTEFLGTMGAFSLGGDIIDDHISTFGNVVGRQDVIGVINEIFHNGNESGEKLANEIEQNQRMKDTRGVVEIGYQSGVFADTFNYMYSGKVVVSSVKILRNVVHTDNIALALFLIFAGIIVFWLYVLIADGYGVSYIRTVLEGRIYKKLPIQNLLYLFRNGKLLKVSWAMLRVKLFKILWAFTIVGGLIKHFSYFMVPYIIAENPDISGKEAIKLSSKITKGHKWELFILSVSFFLWNIFGVLTLGIGYILYVNPYKTVTYAEYAVYLRKIAKDNNLELVDRLNDKYLYQLADDESINNAYSDVFAAMKVKRNYKDTRKGLAKFFADKLGVILVMNKAEAEHQKYEKETIGLKYLQLESQKETYPLRLSNVPVLKKYQEESKFRYTRAYSIWTLISIFFIVSIIGWGWEVLLHIIMDGKFINRGILHGPWLPIYGQGGVLILAALYKLRKHPTVLFFITILLCGMVEYFAGIYLEDVYNTRWWEYNGYFLNINGRVCAEGLIVFGIGGIAMVYFVAPLIDTILSRFNKKIIIGVCVVFIILFAADLVYSVNRPNVGEGITFDKVETMEKIKLGEENVCSGTISSIYGD